MKHLPPFAVIADPHIWNHPGTQDAHLRAAFTRAKTLGAAFIVLAGDMTQGGGNRQFQRMHGMVQTAGLPVFPVLGNKDPNGTYEGGSTQEYRRFFGRPHYVAQCAGYRLVVADAHQADIPAHQMRWLEHALPDGTADNTLVIGHRYLGSIQPAAREQLLATLEAHDIRHYICAHKHRKADTEYGRVTEHMLQTIDPDRALDSMPGLTMVQLQENGRLRKEFVPVSIPAELIEQHLLQNLGLAPARWGSPDEIATLAGEYPFSSYQLRLDTQAGYEYLAQQATTARKFGMEIVGHLQTPSLDESGTLYNEDDLYSGIEFCAEQGAQIVVLHPPKLPAHLLTDHSGALRSERPLVAAILDYYENCVLRMENLGMRVAIENNSSKKRTTTFAALPIHLRGLINALRQRNLQPGFCFDVGHARASMTRVGPAEWMGALGEDLLCTHLHTGDPVTHSTHGPICELFGDTQWYGIAAWLAYLHAQLPCMLEVRTAEAASASTRTLQTLAHAHCGDGDASAR